LYLLTHIVPLLYPKKTSRPPAEYNTTLCRWLRAITAAPERILARRPGATRRSCASALDVTVSFLLWLPLWVCGRPRLCWPGGTKYRAANALFPVPVLGRLGPFSVCHKSSYAYWTRPSAILLSPNLYPGPKRALPLTTPPVFKH